MDCQIFMNTLYLLRVQSEKAGRAQFNLATATYAAIAYSAVWFINKTHLNLLQEGFNVEPQPGFSVKMIFHII